MSDPYKITFSPDADGGPLHVLYLLKGFGVELRKDGAVVHSGLIVSTGEYSTVRIKRWCEQCDDYCGGTVDVDIFDGTFDEVVYL